MKQCNGVQFTDGCTCWRVQVDYVSCLAPGVWVAVENYASILTVLAAFCKFDFEWSVLVDEACTSHAESALQFTVLHEASCQKMTSTHY